MRTGRTRTGRLWTVALAAVVTGALGAVVVSAPTGAAAATRGEEADVQIGLITTASTLKAAAQQQAGWTGISVDATTSTLTLFWNGDLPASVAKAVDNARRSATVVVRPSRYNERTLLAAGSKVLPQEGVTSVAPMPDGSGIAVGVEKDAETGARLPLVAASPVPVFLQPFMHPILAVGRQHDVAPYSNGSMYHWPLPGNFIGLCTTGFAVTVANQSRILSAGHCGTDGQTMYAGNGGAPSNTVLGTVSGDDNGHDTLLLNASSVGKTFYGDINSTLSKTTHMVLDTFVGTLVCTSGAMTGQHCKIRIKYVNQTIKVDDEDGNLYSISPVVQADQDDHAVAVGQGDSGGPVVAQDSSTGFVLVYPTGTITAEDGNTAVACGTSVYPTNCAWRMFYADVPSALTRYNATIK